MEEFIENFNEFREYLYEKQTNCSSPEERKLMDSIVEKFKSLGLDNVF